MKTILRFGITGFVLFYFFCAIGSDTWDVMKFTDGCAFLFALGTFGCIGMGMIFHFIFEKEEEMWETEKNNK